MRMLGNLPVRYAERDLLEVIFSTVTDAFMERKQSLNLT
jgi:hypothetical protein